MEIFEGQTARLLFERLPLFKVVLCLLSNKRLTVDQITTFLFAVNSQTIKRNLMIKIK